MNPSASSPRSLRVFTSAGWARRHGFHADDERHGFHDRDHRRHPDDNRGGVPLPDRGEPLLERERGVRGDLRRQEH